MSPRLVGFSSLWMFIVGGTLGVFLDILNEIKVLRAINYKLRVIMGASAIVCLEFISGVILNMFLKFDIWDYSKNPFNLLGQIDLLHSLYWFIITPFGFWVGDIIRYYIFDEEKPEDIIYYYTRLIK